MSTNFPSSVDSFTNPTTSDTLASVPHASQHADVNDAVEAIETALLDGAPLHIDDANERVGIGTTSPQRLLDIRGASSPEIRLQSTDSTDPSIYFGDQVDAVRGGIAYDVSENALQFRGYNNNTRMTIDSSGNVGIGATTPSADLHIADTDTVLHLQDTDGTVGGSMSSMLQFTDSTGAVQSQVGLGTGVGFFIIDNNDGPMRVGTASADSLYLRTNNTEQLTIDSTGNVGINDTTPSYKLDVNGDINTTGDLRVGGKVAGMVLLRDQTFTGYGGVDADVLSSDYSHYMVQFYGKMLTTDRALYLQFRRSGADLTGSNYTYGVNGVTHSTGSAFTDSSSSTTLIRLGSILTTGCTVSAFITLGYDNRAFVTWQNHTPTETWNGTGSFNDGSGAVTGFTIFRTSTETNMRVRVYGIPQ